MSDPELPKKINIGCGFDIRPGYLNVDSGAWHNPDLIADVTDLGALPANYFHEALAQDVLEHIGRQLQVATLSGWARLLIEGGLLSIRVPSIVDLVGLLSDSSFESLEQQHYWVQMVHGTQAYPGDFHLCAYTCSTIADLGRQAGLFISEASIKDRWLFEIKFKKTQTEEALSSREWLSHQYMVHARRVPDEEGIQYWVNVLEQGSMSRFEIMHTLNQSRRR